MGTARIALIRHSITEWNEIDRIQGQFNSPLTENGINLAKSWIAKLNPQQFDAVICSDLGRAIQTAEIVTAGIDIPFFMTEGLREEDWGIWSGMLLSDIKNDYHEELEKQVMKGWDFRPPNGESRTEVADRAEKSLNSEIDKVIKTTGNNSPKILAVSHEGVLKALIYRLLGHDFMPTPKKILKKRRLHWLNFDGTLSIASLNNDI
jgi:probable phosphoglycerate mutase